MQGDNTKKHKAYMVVNQLNRINTPIAEYPSPGLQQKVNKGWGYKPLTRARQSPLVSKTPIQGTKAEENRKKKSSPIN